LALFCSKRLAFHVIFQQKIALGNILRLTLQAYFAGMKWSGYDFPKEPEPEGALESPSFRSTA
jgi:hypothetical protein